MAVAAVVASALAGAALAAAPALERRLPLPAAATLAGTFPPVDEPLDTWLQRRASLEAEREVSLLHPDGALLAPRAELGQTFDTAAALSELGKPRQPPGLLTRLRVACGADAPTPIDIEPSYRFDAARAARFLADIATGLRVEPVDARLDLPGHARIEARSGRELDWGATLSRLAALGSRDSVELAFTELVPKIPSSALADVDPSLVLSEYETDFAKRGGPRVRNIARAAQLLDGTIMLPGEVWSFNRSIGPRTLERGFIDAPVIVADELEPGVGGGVCQVATTLFAAAVLGGLDVVRRRSHSRPSGYAPLGLDATVIDGEVDLQLKNPYPVPIIVHALLPTKTRIRVEMLGTVAPGKIEHSYAVRKSEDFFRKVTRHPELLPDQVKRHQKGIPGYDVVSTVRTHYLDGSERVRRYHSTYYPVPEVYWVGSDVDPDSLPPLPERATHTVVSSDGQGEGAETTPATFSQ